MTIDTVIRYADNKNMVCGCGEELFFDGSCSYELPIGFGSHAKKDGFYVDKVRYNGWFSRCMACHKVTLAYTKKRIISKQLELTR